MDVSQKREETIKIMHVHLATWMIIFDCEYVNLDLFISQMTPIGTYVKLNKSITFEFDGCIGKDFTRNRSLELVQVCIFERRGMRYVILLISLSNVSLFLTISQAMYYLITFDYYLMCYLIECV